MTDRRIRDTSGAAWPITGHRCPVCRMPSDAANANERYVHPLCAAERVLTPQEHADVIKMLCDVLGASRLPVGPTDTWRKSGGDLPDNPIYTAIQAANTYDELLGVWRTYEHRGWNAHFTKLAAQRRAEIQAQDDAA